MLPRAGALNIQYISNKLAFPHEFKWAHWVSWLNGKKKSTDLLEKTVRGESTERPLESQHRRAYPQTHPKPKQNRAGISMNSQQHSLEPNKFQQGATKEMEKLCPTRPSLASNPSTADHSGIPRCGVLCCLGSVAWEQGRSRGAGQMCGGGGLQQHRLDELDRKSTRLNSSHL